MAMTRKSLKAMGLTDEQIDSIIDMHTETVDGLKAQRDEAKEKADKYDAAQKELDALKAKGDDGYKEKYESEHQAFENFKAQQTARESKAAKEAAVKAYFESKNITGNNLDIVMMASGATVDALELADGKIKDTKTLDDLVSGKFASLVSKTETKGASVSHPANNGGGGALTREQIAQIKDPAERRAAIAENMSLYEKGE